MRDDRLGRREWAGRVRKCVERTRSLHDELQDLGEPPGGEHRDDNRCSRRDASTVQAARAEQEESEDPPEEAVPVEIGDRDSDHRGHDVPLLGDREVELSVEIPQSGEKVVQRARTWRQTKTATPRTMRPATM